MIKKLFLALSIAIIMLVTVGGVAAQPVLADSLFSGSRDAACGGAQANDGVVKCDATTSGTTIDALIKTVLNLLSILVGVAAVIMIMIGGFKFVTSQGEASNTASARNTIVYAIVGLVVVALAQFIVHFVLNKATPKTPATPTSLIQEVKPLDVGRVFVV